MLTFEFSEIIAKVESERVITKTEILRTAARLYDPLVLPTYCHCENHVMPNNSIIKLLR